MRMRSPGNFGPSGLGLQGQTEGPFFISPKQVLEEKNARPRGTSEVAVSVVAPPSEETSAEGLSWELRLCRTHLETRGGCFWLWLPGTLRKFLHVSGAGPFLWTTAGMLA